MDKRLSGLAVGRAMALAAGLAVAAGDARAELVSTCLPELDAAEAISLAVDDRGTAHIARVFPVSGEVVYTTSDPVRGHANTFVADFVSILAVDEITDTDLMLVDGVPYICFYNGRNDRLEVAFAEGGGWVREVVAEGPRVGDACGLFVVDGAPGVAFRDRGVLSAARRRGADDWQVVEADGGGVDVGHQVDVATLADGRVVAVHRDDGPGDVRISFRGLDGRWRTEVADQVNRAGVRPRVVPDGMGSVWVVHGLANPEASDGGLLLTVGEAGEWVTISVDDDELGGANGAAAGPDGALGVMTRVYRRSALFGDFDGLRYYPMLDVDSNYVRVASHDAGQRRVGYASIDLAYDPFGLPVAAMRVQSSPFGAQQGTTSACIWREADRDRDRLPDVLEGRYRADADDPDTDGDGVLDGDEVLDGTDPAGQGGLPDPLPVDMGVEEPEPDLGPPLDFGPLPDLGPGPDGGVVETDFGAPVDAEVAFDTAAPDAEAFDLGLDDAAVDGGAVDAGRDAAVDGALVDARVDDAAVEDAAPRRDGQVADSGGAGGDGGGGGAGGAGGGGEGDATVDPPGGAPSDDGCRAQPGGDSTGWGLAALLGLALGGRRRRRG